MKGCRFKMNWNIVEGKWKELAGSAREQWGKVTDDEWQQLAGKRDKLEGLLQQKYGVTQEDAAKQIDDWASKLKEAVR